VRGGYLMTSRAAGHPAFTRLVLLLGAFLALAAVAAGQPEESHRRPLPEIRQLLADVRANQKQIDRLVDQYSCTEKEGVREFHKNGTVKKTVLSEYEDFYLGGEPVRRQVKKDGRPLSAGQQKKEDERVEKHIRDYEKRQREEGGETTRKRKEQADISTFLRVSNFIHPRWETFRQHEVIVFDFLPNPDYRPQNWMEDLLHKLAGTAWVDEDARQVVRLEARLSDTFKVAGGLVASLRKGSSLVIEQAKTNEEVWLPSYVEAHLSARLLLFAGAQGDYTSYFTDYKKFRVETLKH